MKILHAPTEIAGQMGMLCEGLREKGYDANGYNWFLSYLKYNGHIIDTDAFELIKVIEPLVDYCDIIHFHNGNTFLQNYHDLPFIAKKQKKLIMHHWGNDVRTVKKVSESNPYILPPSYMSDDVIHNKLSFLSTYIDTAIVQDSEMLPYVNEYYKKVHVLPLACNTNKFKVQYPSPDKKVPSIIHAPTNRDFKGSAYVETAISMLNKEPNIQFIYQTIENMTHAEAINMYLEADIIVDQLLCGTYGMLSVEAMAMGKVVVAFIRDDVRQSIPKELPIIAARPENITEVLRDLIKDPVRRHEIGLASRKFTKEFHDNSIVIDKLTSIYKEQL